MTTPTNLVARVARRYLQAVEPESETPSNAAEVHPHPALPDPSFEILVGVGKKHGLHIYGKPSLFIVESMRDSITEEDLRHQFKVLWNDAAECARQENMLGHGFNILSPPELYFPHNTLDEPAKSDKLASDKPSKAQLDYARHLLKQVGAEELNLDMMSGLEVSKLIDGLKTKRGKPVFHGNGQFSRWEKKASATYWDDAVKDLNQFNSLYTQVERKPQDPVVLRKCANGINRFIKLFVWARKCLTKDVYDEFRDVAGDISKLVKNKAAPVEELQGVIQRYKKAVQGALDGTAPESFTYQGFNVVNEEHISDELCRKTLAGVDFLKALFKKRGVNQVLEQGVARILLVLDAGATAFFNAGTRELTLSVSELSKGNPGRILDSFTGETVLHEFGHYVHRNYITGEAAEAWDAPWEGLPSLAGPHGYRGTDPKRQEKLDPLEIVTEYGKTDKYEDFAETFMVFMGAPEKLTPTARFRMQKALSLSGLYGKPVLRLATDWEKKAKEVVGNFLFVQRVAARYKKKIKTDAGNTVYTYSERQIANRNRKKAERIEKLRKSIGKVRSKVKRDLKSSDPEKLLTALAVALIDHTYERVGNDESAKDGHFGVTGWKKKHISFNPKGATIKYVGKSGVKHEKKVTDSSIRAALRDAYEGCDDDSDGLFSREGAKVTPEKVNEYLAAFDITAKDLRGFHANREMQDRLKSIRAKGKKLPEDKKAREKLLKGEFLKALDDTAEAVGHEASTLRSQYLVPGLEETFMKDGTVSEKFGYVTAYEIDDLAENVVRRYLLARTITKRDLDPWKADLRRMTKIYRSIPAAEEEKRTEVFVEAKRLFKNFAENFQTWVYKVLLPALNPENKSRSKTWMEEDVRKKAWDAIVAIQHHEMFPSSWDYKSDTYTDAPWDVARNVDRNIRRYQHAFGTAFDAIEQYIESEEQSKGQPLERREQFETHTIAGMNVVIHSLGRDDVDYESDIDDFLHKLDFFAKRIERAGFASAIRGLTVNVNFADPEKLARPTDLTAGLYRANSDSMEIYPLGFLSSDGGTFTHESGHRFWFRELSNNARAHWNEVVGSRMLEITPKDVEDFLKEYGDSKLYPRELAHLVEQKETDPEKAAKYKELAGWYFPDQANFRDTLMRQVGEKVHIEDISDYARTSPVEAFAEAFRFYILKGPQALGPWTRQFFERIVRSGGAKFASKKCACDGACGGECGGNCQCGGSCSCSTYDRRPTPML